MINHEQKNWVLVQFKPNSDAIAVRNLNRQGIEVFLPRIEHTKRIASKFKATVKPLFPGYLFASVTAHSADWRAINSTFGVSRIVTTGSRPTPVPNGLIDELKKRCDVDGVVATPTAFIPGDEVQVNHGPFTDWIGKVVEIAPEQRVWVLLDFMGRQARVAVNMHDLDAI